MNPTNGSKFHIDESTIAAITAAQQVPAPVAHGNHASWAPPARESSMNELVNLLLAQYSPQVANMDGTPSPDQAIFCGCVAASQSMQGVLSRHPSIPGMMRLLSPGKGPAGAIMVEYFFHIDELKSIAVAREDIKMDGPRIVST